VSAISLEKKRTRQSRYSGLERQVSWKGGEREFNEGRKSRVPPTGARTAKRSLKCGSGGRDISSTEHREGGLGKKKNWRVKNQEGGGVLWCVLESYRSERSL